MKMNKDDISPRMFAPCGMNCKVCYKHCYSKKSCNGCMANNGNTPKHCRACKIKDCVKTHRLTYCFECMEFPCKLIKNIDKSYIARYHVSLIENSNKVKVTGLQKFMMEDKEKYTCSYCGGVISLHDKECSECHEKTSK
mgnify:CR=1 FL=1